ncbi:M50 family metallopeptidase [Thalassotalea atypica]|uniref:M50 family metallopeptidase n=1 Tax=Thalassotalea atypica TaxID=2054316 RepID=UPI0025726EEA|nr:M50 family metallopeptidase [Thalassotalea atypica]
MTESTSNNSSFFSRYQFWILLVLAGTLRSFPIVSVPFNWLESYFHEISHGLAALLSGGKIIRIQLFLDGAGLCTSQGGSRLFTSFMGYAGAAVWGAIIYQLARQHLLFARGVCITILLLLIASCIFWTQDLLTLFILTILILVFSLKLKLADNDALQKVIQLVGLTVLLNALMSPFYLIDGRALGDGATLSELTLVPEIIWVVIWFAIGSALLVWLAKSTSKMRKKS